MSVLELKEAVRNISDFPIEGIEFKDITTLFQSPERLHQLSDILHEMYHDKGITKVVGIESRGFFMGPAIALRLNAGFAPIRKPGKLPYKVLEMDYMKEYGPDTIQIHVDAVNHDDIVLLHDDLLATGGTMLAAYNLIKKMGVKKIYINFLIELTHLNARKNFPKDVEIISLLQFDD